MYTSLKTQVQLDANLKAANFERTSLSFLGQFFFFFLVGDPSVLFPFDLPCSIEVIGKNRLKLKKI